MKINSPKLNNFLTVSFALWLLLVCLQSATAQNTFPSSGNAGAGGTSPLTPLEVYGPVISTFTGNTRGALSIGITGNPTDLYYRAIDFNYNDSYGPAARIAMKYDGGLGSYLYFGTSNSTVSGVTNNALVIDPNGRIGIGTTNPGTLNGVNFGNVALHVKGAGTSKYVAIDDSTTVGFLLNDSSQAADSRMWALLNQNSRVSLSTVSDAGSPTEKLSVMRNGNVGIGTTGPSEKLEVAGTVKSSGGLTLTGAPSEPGYLNALYLGMSGNTAIIDAVDQMVDFRDLVISAKNFRVGTWNGGSLVTGLFQSSAGNVGIGTTSPAKALAVVGDIDATGAITGGSINAKYQDVAEWVESSQSLPSGTVVVLDQTKSNQVVASSGAYDTRVAGVVSAKPGITLGEKSQSKVLVATTGRVKVFVDATSGPIAVGDLLVTSDIPGVAMKSQPVSIGSIQLHRPGTLIGKALEPLSNGRGEILVLLSLQ